MGGAASTPKAPAPTVPSKANGKDQEILKSASTKSYQRGQRIPKFKVATNHNFAVADRTTRPVDPDKTADEIWAQLCGPADTDSSPDFSENVAVKQIIKCKSRAREQSEFSRIAEQLSDFLVNGAKNADSGLSVMCLTGSAGSGVSTAIAKAIVLSASKIEAANCTLVFREIDATLCTARLLISSICDQLGVSNKTMTEVIMSGTRESPLVLVIDGLSHLTDCLSDSSMEWLVPALRSSNNAYARVLLSTTPYPNYPAELAICRSLHFCSIVQMPTLTIAEAQSFLDRQYHAFNIPPLEPEFKTELTKSLELAATPIFGGITPCYIKLLVSGTIYPRIIQTVEKPASPVPASAYEAFEQLLVVLENSISNEPVPAAAGVVPVRISKSEADARRHLARQTLGLLSLPRHAFGLTAEELGRLAPPSPHAVPAGRSAPTAAEALAAFARAACGLSAHLRADADGRWAWAHSLARDVAAFRYHAFVRPTDALGAANPDDATRFMAAAFADFLAAQKRAHSPLSSMAAKEMRRMLCIAQRKNDLLDSLLDLRSIVAMFKAWGGAAGCLYWLQIYRRFALIERGTGIFLRRDRMDELEAIIYLVGKNGKVLDLAVREKKLDIAWKQILRNGVEEYHAAAGVLTGFLKKIEEGEKEVMRRPLTSRNLSDVLTSDENHSTEEATKFWEFDHCMNTKVDAFGQPAILIIEPSNDTVTNFASPDGRFVVALVGFNQIRTFEATPFREIWTYISEETITAISISQTGKITAIARNSGILIYKTSTGTKISEITTFDDSSDADLGDAQQPRTSILITHMKFQGDAQLLISTQVGQIYSWRLGESWTGVRCFSAHNVPVGDLGHEQTTTRFCVSADSLTAAWYVVVEATGSSLDSVAAAGTKLAVYDMCLDAPSDALSQRALLDLPSATAPIEFDIVSTFVVVVEDDALYCVDAKSGNLEWSLTTFNAGLMGDWVNVCFFKDFESEEAVIGVTADGWAVDVTKGYVRWRVYLGLPEGDSIVCASALNGRIPKQKHHHLRNQFSYGHYVVYSTKKGGLYAAPIHQLSLGLKSPAVLTPVIGHIVSVSCDCVTGETVGADSANALHISSAQQLKVVSDERETVLTVSVINSAIIIVTAKGIISFPALSRGNAEFDCESSALSSTPKTHVNSIPIVLSKAVAVGEENSPSTLIVILDAKNSLNIFLVTPADPTPTLQCSIPTELSQSDPIVSLSPIVAIESEGVARHVCTRVAVATAAGSIIVFAISAPGAPPAAAAVITRDVFADSGIQMGAKLTCMHASATGSRVAVGDSRGGIMVVELDSNATGAPRGLRMQYAHAPAAVCDVRWLEEAVMVALGRDGVAVVWTLDFTRGTAAAAGIMDVCGAAVPTCFEAIAVQRDNVAGGCPVFRVCVGTADGCVLEFVLADSRNSIAVKIPNSP